MAPEKLDRLILVQAHASGLLIGAAALLVASAIWLTRIPGGTSAWRSVFFTAAATAAAAGLGPFLVGTFTVRLQRFAIWGAWVLAVAACVAGAWLVDLRALAAPQMILGAAMLTELGPRRRVLGWFWFCAVVIVLVVAGYHWMVEVRPAID